METPPVEEESLVDRNRPTGGGSAGPVQHAVNHTAGGMCSSPAHRGWQCRAGAAPSHVTSALWAACPSGIWPGGRQCQPSTRAISTHARPAGCPGEEDSLPDPPEWVLKEHAT